MDLTDRLRRHAAKRHRSLLQEELTGTLAALRANDEQFRQAVDPYYIEEVIYEHAALLCRCSALLRELRAGAVPCRR